MIFFGLVLNLPGNSSAQIFAQVGDYHGRLKTTFPTGMPESGRHPGLVQGARTPGLSYVRDPDYGDEAYDLRKDPGELVNLLKTGNMDYAWEYLSVAVQHGLKYIKLDDHINLGNYAFDPFYKMATVKVTGKKPGTWITRTGQSVTYGITLIKAAPSRTEAVKFLEYMLSAQGGLKILADMGQPPFIPSRVSSAQIKESLPGNLPALVEVKN